MTAIRSALVLSVLSLLLLSLASVPAELDHTMPSFADCDDDADCDGVPDAEDLYPNGTVVQEILRDTRARGAGEEKSNLSAAHALAALLWSDADGDGFADQVGTVLSDHCPAFAGESYRERNGCGDIDGDGLPDELDPDADGDGISNDLELAASTATIQYSIYDPSSAPADNDYDGIPDERLDPDDDNDGWADDVELERGSDPYNKAETPFNLYGGMSTGVFYVAGEGFTDDPGSDGLELSLSWLLTALTTELIIPIGLIPVYIAMWGYRKRKFRDYEKRILECDEPELLFGLEMQVNNLVREKKIRTYQGLVLRNAIELREGELGIEPDDPLKREVRLRAMKAGSADEEE